MGPSKAETTTDERGDFSFTQIALGVYEIDVRSKTLGLASRKNIVISGDEHVSIEYLASVVNGLRVIGSVSTSANANFNVTPASIAAVSPSQTALDGETSWRRMLEQIPGVTTGGGSYINEDLPDGPQLSTVLSINGALPYETATLVDGMPLVGNSFSTPSGSGYDLSILPLNAFDRAEVVRGPGADSPSIVDSIGGSFVLHPADRVTQNSFDFATTTDPYGGVNSTAIAALRLNKLSVRLAYGIDDSPGPINGSGAAAVRFNFNSVEINGKPFYCTGTCKENIVPSTYSDFVLASYGNVACCFNASTAWSEHNGALSLSYDLSPATTATVFYGGSSSQEPLAYAISATDFTPPAGYTGSYPSGFSNLFCDDYPTCQYPIYQGSSLLFERVNTHLGPGNLEIAALQSNTFGSSVETQPSSFTTHLYGGGAYGTAANNTPVVFNGGTYNITSLGGLSISGGLNFDSNRDYIVSYAVPIGASSHVGFSYVNEWYNDPSSYFYSFFDQPGGSGGTSASNYFASHEFRLSGGTEVAPRVNAELSLYSTAATFHVQNPNNIGTYVDERFPYTAPRAGLTWRPSTNVVVRGSLGGGYALQSLGNEIGSNGAPQLSNGQYTVSPENLNLKPETSFGFDVGTDLRLHPDSVFSFDLYRTNLYGQIFSSTALDGTYNGLPLYVTENGNLGQSRYEGFLFDIRHDPFRGLAWHVAAGMTRAYVVSVPGNFYNTNSCTLCANQEIVIGPNFSGAYSTSVPYSQGAGTIGYRFAPKKFIELAANYFGPGNSYYQPAFMEFDARAGYPLARHAALALTFRNFTNINGQAIRTEYDNLGAPVVSGLPYGLFRNPYGPRALMLTTSFDF